MLDFRREELLSIPRATPGISHRFILNLSWEIIFMAYKMTVTLTNQASQMLAVEAIRRGGPGQGMI
jgi:hypothetical protein